MFKHLKEAFPTMMTEADFPHICMDQHEGYWSNANNILLHGVISDSDNNIHDKFEHTSPLLKLVEKSVF